MPETYPKYASDRGECTAAVASQAPKLLLFAFPTMTDLAHKLVMTKGNHYELGTITWGKFLDGTPEIMIEDARVNQVPRRRPPHVLPEPCGMDGADRGHVLHPPLHGPIPNGCPAVLAHGYHGAGRARGAGGHRHEPIADV